MSKPADVEVDQEDVLRTALAWHDAGRPIALATVVKTWGSSPRPAGSNLVIAADGAFEGSVSVGCVEGAVIQAAQGAMESGQPAMLEFGVSDEQAWEVGLACGGTVKIFVEKVEC